MQSNINCTACINFSALNSPNSPVDFIPWGITLYYDIISSFPDQFAKKKECHTYGLLGENQKIIAK